jgi:sugar lactone lactonase YvrE
VYGQYLGHTAGVCGWIQLGALETAWLALKIQCKNGKKEAIEMTVEVTRVGTIQNQLGEGPLWDPRNELLYWVDSKAGYVHCISGTHEAVMDWQVNKMIGCMALRESGGAMIALSDGFYSLDFDSGEIVQVRAVEAEDDRTRFNDGKTDRNGNFLAGSMGMKIRDRPLSALYRMNADLSMDVLENDVIVSNGPCFSPEGSTLYFNDGRRRVLAYDYDPETADLANKRVFIDSKQQNCATDGATIDTDGNMWAALIGSAAIGCFDHNGQLQRKIEVPVNLPSSVMFGGTDLDVLYVTSISDSGNRVSLEPGAGGLYRITGLGVKGIEEAYFKG